MTKRTEEERAFPVLMRFTVGELDTIRDLIRDWGFEYSLCADREEVIELARKLDMKREDL
jgi:hypothetical protein